MKRLNSIMIGLAAMALPLGVQADVFASDVTVQSTDPDFILDDTSIGFDHRWLFSTDADLLNIKGQPEGGALTNIMSIDVNSPAGALSVGSDGSVSFGNGLAPNVGIGTSTPSQELSISTDDPAIRLNDTNGPAGSHWTLNNDTESSIFDISWGTDADGIFSPFKIERDSPNNALVLDSGGGIGIGTSSPDNGAAMEIDADAVGKSRSLLVDKEIAVIADSAQGLLRVANSTTGQSWCITLQGDDSLAIKPGGGTSTGSAIVLRPDGTIKLAGDVDITGSLTCGGGSC